MIPERLVGRFPRVITRLNPLVNPRKEDIFAVVILAMMTIGCFWKSIFTRDYSLLSFYDNSVQSYAWYQVLSQSVARGEIPLWDPYVLGGHSFIGEIQSGAFYLPNLIVAWLAHGQRVTTGQIETLLIVHVFAGACFMYALGRYLGLRPGPAVLSGVVFAFGGVVLGRLQDQSNIFMGLIWLPLAVLCLEIGIRRRLLAVSGCAGLALSAAFIAGHIQPPFHIAVALGLQVLFHVFSARDGRDRVRAIVAGMVAGIVGGLASAVQLLPALEYGSLSLRAVGLPELVPSTARLSYATLGNVSMQPSNLISILVPRLNLPPDTNPYLGLAAIALAVAAVAWSRNRWVGFALILGAYGLLTALSDSSVVHGWEYSIVPLSDRIREAGRRLYLVQFAVALLAGMGLESLISRSIQVNRERARSFARLCVYPALGFLVFGTIVTLFPIYPKLVTDAQVGEPLLHTALVGFALLGAVGSIAAGRLGTRATTILLVSIVTWDLFSAMILIPLERGTANTTTNLYPERFYAPSPVTSFLVDHASEGRVDILTDSFPPNVGDVFAFRTILGHGATLLSSYKAFLDGGWSPGSKVSQMLGVSYYVAEKSLGTELPVATDGNVSVYPVSTGLPRVWIVHDVSVVDGASAAVAAINSPTFDISSEAVVDSPPPAGALASRVPSSLEHVSVYASQTQSLVAIASLSSPGLVVASDEFYPGWNATIDGQPAPIVRANVTLRGVYVPAGDHVITFAYQPKSVEHGIELSFAGMLLLVIFAVFDLAIRSQSFKRVLLTGFAITGVIAVIGAGLWLVSDPLGERRQVGPTTVIFLDHMLGQATIQEPAGSVPRIAALVAPGDSTKVVILQHPDSTVTYDLRLPRSPTLNFGTQIDPRCAGINDGASFQLTVDDGTGPKIVFRQDLKPGTGNATPNRLPTTVDLAAYSERQVKLTTTTSVGPTGNYACAWAEWVSPAIVGQ